MTGDSEAEADGVSSSKPARKIASPEATGGAGTNYEARFAGVVLARLLRGDHVDGLGLPVQRVQFQGRFAGHLLDDVVAEGADALGRTRIIEYQAKRTLSPAPSDDEFKETVARCIEALQRDGEDGEIDRRLRRFGLVANPSGALTDLSRVTDIARAHNSAGSFLEVVRATAKAGVVQRLEQLRTTVSNCLTDREDELAAAPLEAEVDDLAWRVARAMWIWQADAEPEGHVLLAAKDRLADLVLADTDPSDVLDKLITLARDWAPHAGSIDVAMLRVALEEKGVALSATPARAAAFNALLAASEKALDTGVVLLGGQLRLPRYQLRASVVDTVRQNNATLLRGRAGVGKSMLARLVAEDLRSEGDVVVGLNLAGRTGNLPALEEELRVRLADGMAGAPIGSLRVLLIDGAEQAQTDSGQLLRAIFEALPKEPGVAPPWRLLVTARDEAEGTIAGPVTSSFGAPERIAVGELSDAEVTEVVTAFPALEPLRRNPRAVALLLRRPYLVELLIRSTAVMGLPPDIVGEEDLMDVVTLRLVRRDNGGLAGRGAPDARSDIYLALAQDAIANSLPSSLAGTDAEARAGLSSDDVIAPVRWSWRFAHDVLTDYAVATRLLEPGGDTLLAAAPAPRRLLRGVRLRMQRRLADALTEDRLLEAWAQTVTEAEQLAQTDGPRWRDVPFEALLHLGAVREALGILRPVLLADATLLSQLVDVADRLARLETTTEEWAPIALDTSLTGPVVDLLGALGDEVPDRCVYRAARLVHRHLVAGLAYKESPEHGLVDAQRLPGTLMGWVGDASYGDTLEMCLGSLGLLAHYLDDAAESFLIEHASSRPHEVAELVESRWATRALANARPALLLTLAGLYYLGRGLTLDGRVPASGRMSRSRSARLHGIFVDDLDGEGVRDRHDPRQAPHISPYPLGNNQANPELGPFLALLEADAAAGLALVGAIVDVATEGRSRTESGWSQGDPNVRLRLEIPGSEVAKEFVGPPTVWCWHRRTAVGPGPAQSALMALRQWASAKVRAGDSLAAVRDDVLATGTSLAFAAVAWFILLEHLDGVTDEMDPFLVHPMVWHLEIGRVVGEQRLALRVPEVTRVDWQVSQVAMQLVLRGDVARRGTLAGLGDVLVANAEAEGVERTVAQRWASDLNIENYRAERHEQGGVAITVEYDPSVVSALSAGSETAQRGLRSGSLMRQAAALRDDEGDLAEAEPTWRAVIEHLDTPGGDVDLLYTRADLICAAAAAVVRAAAADIPIDDGVLGEAITTLLEGAAQTAKLAPPLREDDVQVADDADAAEQEAAPERFIRENVWPDGMDRSVASGLSCLLQSPELIARAGVDRADVLRGLFEVAASPFDETRERLASEVPPLWDVSCESDDAVHEAILAVASRLVETAGYGPLTGYGYGYSPATLPSPVEGVLAGSDELMLDVDSAAFAIRLLRSGAEQTCGHAERAQQLLDALISYDERVWPDRYARHHYSRTGRWRSGIDHVVARWVLLGQTELLERRLDVFSPVGEELRGLLTALVEEAEDAELAARLHAVWPRVLDRLLPEARDLRASDSGREHPYHRDVDELDDALLLVPGDGVDFWPWSETVQLAGPWFRAFRGRPERADRAIKFAGRLFGINSDLAVLLVLEVLGDDPGRILRSSQLAVAFLQVTLQNPPAEPLDGRVRALLDGLAREGDEYALRVQRELENG